MTERILIPGELRLFEAHFNLLVYELGEDSKRKKGVMPHVVTLKGGDVLVMEGAFDSRFHHAFKPEEDRRTGLRLSLTYRKHV